VDDLTTNKGLYALYELQWGHGEFAVDDGKEWPEGTPYKVLQWGHGEFAVDDSSSSPNRNGQPTSFNGATANSPWMTSTRVLLLRSLIDSFNGATANSPWMTHRPGDPGRPTGAASMGPRRIRRG